MHPSILLCLVSSLFRQLALAMATTTANEPQEPEIAPIRLSGG